MFKGRLGDKLVHVLHICNCGNGKHCFKIKVIALYFVACKISVCNENLYEDYKRKTN